MNKTNIIVSSVLAVAIVVLYILHFTSGASTVTHSAGRPNGVLPNANIVYVNVDSLLPQYDMYYEMKNQLSTKQKRMESEFASKSKNYERGVLDFQDKVQKGLVTRSKAQEMEQQLMGEQQNLLKLRDQMTQELAEEEQVMNRQLINEIVEYLKVYNQDGKFQYVMSYSFGSNLLFVPDSLDITNDVLKGLNESFDKSEKKGLKKNFDKSEKE